jgi:hypothetical protein
VFEKYHSVASWGVVGFNRTLLNPAPNCSDSARLFYGSRENLISKCIFSPENVCIEKLMLPSESAPQELSNEWSCQYVSTILNFGTIYVTRPGDFCHHQSLKMATLSFRIATDYLGAATGAK